MRTTTQTEAEGWCPKSDGASQLELAPCRVGSLVRAADVCAGRRPSTGGLGLGSLSFAITRTWTPTPERVPNGIAAGHWLVRPHERRRPQAITLTLRVTYVFPMTSHVEVVAHLVKATLACGDVIGAREHEPRERAVGLTLGSF